MQQSSALAHHRSRFFLVFTWGSHAECVGNILGVFSSFFHKEKLSQWPYFSQELACEFPKNNKIYVVEMLKVSLCKSAHHPICHTNTLFEKITKHSASLNSNKSILGFTSKSSTFSLETHLLPKVLNNILDENNVPSKSCLGSNRN